MKKVKILKRFRRGEVYLEPKDGVIDLGDVEATALVKAGLVEIQKRPENRQKK